MLKNTNTTWKVAIPELDRVEEYGDRDTALRKIEKYRYEKDLDAVLVDTEPKRPKSFELIPYNLVYEDYKWCPACGRFYKFRKGKCPVCHTAEDNVFVWLVTDLVREKQFKENKKIGFRYFVYPDD